MQNCSKKSLSSEDKEDLRLMLKLKGGLAGKVVSDTTQSSSKKSSSASAISSAIADCSSHLRFWLYGIEEYIPLWPNSTFAKAKIH